MQFPGDRPREGAHLLLAQHGHLFLPPAGGTPARSSRSFRRSFAAAVSIARTPEAISFSSGKIMRRPRVCPEPRKMRLSSSIDPQGGTQPPCRDASSPACANVSPRAQSTRARHPEASRISSRTQSPDKAIHVLAPQGLWRAVH